MLFLLEKILKHMDKVIPSVEKSVDGKLLVLNIVFVYEEVKNYYVNTYPNSLFHS